MLHPSCRSEHSIYVPPFGRVLESPVGLNDESRPVREGGLVGVFATVVVRVVFHELQAESSRYVFFRRTPAHVGDPEDVVGVAFVYWFRSRQTSSF